MALKMKDKVMIGLLGLLVVVAFFGGQWWNDHKEFTTEKWVGYTDNSRQAIVKNFLDRTVIEGITPDALKEYLGDGEQESETLIAYYLGKPTGLFGDKNAEEEYLVVMFQDGEAIGAQIAPQSALPKE